MAKDFVSRLLVKDQFDRYLADEAAKHPWLNDQQDLPIPLKFVHRMRLLDAKVALKDVDLILHQCFVSLVLIQQLRSAAVNERKRRLEQVEEARKRSEEIAAMPLMEIEHCSELFLTDKGRHTDRASVLSPKGPLTEPAKKISITRRNDRMGGRMLQRASILSVNPKVLSILKPNASVSVAARKSEMMSTQIISNIKNILKRIEGSSDHPARGLLDQFNEAAVKACPSLNQMGSSKLGSNQSCLILREIMDQAKAEADKIGHPSPVGKTGILKRVKGGHRNSSLTIMNKENIDESTPTQARGLVANGDHLPPKQGALWNHLVHNHSKDRMLRRAESTVLGEIQNNSNYEKPQTLGMQASRKEVSKRQPRFLIRSNTQTWQLERRSEN